MSTDTMCSIVLRHISEVFTHAFAECSFCVSYVLFLTHFASDAVHNVVSFA